MIGMVQFDYIRFLYFNKGESLRSIAKQMGIHRNTVRKAIQNPSFGYCLTQPKKKPVNDPFSDRIRYLVEENQKQAKKNQCTKKKMYKDLVKEGYTGTYSTFTWQARKVEQELGIGQSEAFLKLLPLKGSMQVDFGTMWVEEKGVRRKLFAFCAKLCFSKCEYVCVYPRESTEYFLDGLTSAFAFFGGVPKTIVFDNLTPAVKKIKQGTERILQTAFLHFKAFYCFEAVFARPAKGNDKGLVENLVKYVRNNYFLPAPCFHSFQETSEWLLRECRQRNQTEKRDGQTWETWFLQEQTDSFLPFKEVYDCSKQIEAKVDTYQLVHVDRNRYSVPTAYVGKTVQVSLYPFRVKIRYNHTTICTHPRLLSNNEERLHPYHYLSLLQKKARAYDQAKVIHDWKLPSIYETYRKLLQAHVRSSSKGTREFIEILRLTEDHGVPAIAEILTDLHAKNQYGVQEVISVLRCQQEKTSGSKPLARSILTKHKLDTIALPPPSLDSYNALLKMGDCK